MAVCPNCGEDNPDRARFCMVCATPLDQAPQSQAEERKVVSVLFVDLVGFTARSHELDPEDVRAALLPYYERLKREIEVFGGRVEKFIGDAVMAVFGVPATHEDDAERAVRAALRITDAMTDLNETIPGPPLSIRVAVNTGEVLVNLSARPRAREGIVAGDVVNTASRLQQVAPVNEVVVGEITFRSTDDQIVYEEMEPVSVKGKPEPVRVWQALSARSRFGVDVESRYRTPFIGRDLDLATLKTAYQRTLRESSLQLITIVGEPGVGKSRLVAEFYSYVDEQPDLIAWRQGRSLPYGEGITFWALGEIVKAEAGINESDPPGAAADKLATAISTVISDESDRAWLHARIGPLVGATKGGEGKANKEESFTAWLRFLDAMAASRPVVLVFEDLHWADPPLLDFIEYVAEWSTDVPILIIGTARPEFLEKHPNWARGSRNAATISLSPLTDSEIAQLISGLLSQTVLPAQTHAALLEQADGNPLYAEEFIRMLSDRGVLQQKGPTPTLDPARGIPLPANLQALIAARLDTLPSERKLLLNNAAVVGRVFWSGAVGFLSELDDVTTRRALQELVRMELVRPARTSSVEGQQEYSFWHALIRDVSYAQIPRAARGRKHKAMAAWLGGIAGDRVSDRAELLVHHYTQALDLARAAGEEAEARELLEPTRRYLMLAGDRAFELDMERADDYYARALELLPSGHPGRASALVKLGRAAQFVGRNDDAEKRLAEALAESQRGGDVKTQASAAFALDTLAWQKANSAPVKAIILESIARLERENPGPELAAAYEHAAQAARFGGHAAEALEWSNKSLAVADQIGAQTELVAALTARGAARCDLGDLQGIEDLRRAVHEGRRLGLGAVTGLAYSWLAEASWLIEGGERAKRTYEDAIEFVEERGLVAWIMGNRSESLRLLFDLGEWDEIVRLAGGLRSWSQAHEDRQVEVVALYTEAQVLLWRGHLEAAAALEPHLLELARGIGDPQVLVPSLAVAGLIEQAQGKNGAAVELIANIAEAAQGHPWQARHLPSAIRILISAGKLRDATEFLTSVTVPATRDRQCLAMGKAILVEAHHDYDKAIELFDNATQRWADFGFVLEEGQAHLGLGRCRIALGNREQAIEPLRKARDIFTRLGARPLIDEVDHHLDETRALGF